MPVRDLFNRWSFGLAMTWLVLAGCRGASCEAPPEEKTVTPRPDPPQPIESLSLTLEGANVTSLVATRRNDIVIGGYFFGRVRIGDRTVSADPIEEPPRVHVFLARVVEGQVTWVRVFPANEVALARSSDGVPWAVITYDRPVVLGTDRFEPREAPSSAYDWKTPSDLLLWRIGPTGEPLAAAALASQGVAWAPLGGLSVSPQGSPVVLASFARPAPPIRTGEHPVVVASFDKDDARHVRSIELREVVQPRKLAIDRSGALVIAGDDGRVDFGGKTILLRVSPDGKQVAQTELGSNAVVALACRPEGSAVVVVGPPRHWSDEQPLSVSEARLLEVAIDGEVTVSLPLDPAFDVIDLAVRPGGDVVLFGTKWEGPDKRSAWVEGRGAKGERRWSRDVGGGGSKAHALAVEPGDAIWIAAREVPQGGERIPLALWKTVVRRLATE